MIPRFRELAAGSRNLGTEYMTVTAGGRPRERTEQTPKLVAKVRVILAPKRSEETWLEWSERGQTQIVQCVPDVVIDPEH